MFLFADSFDFYASTADAGTRWSSVQQDDGTTRLTSGTAFNAGQALLYFSGNNTLWRAAWPSNEQTIIFSVRLSAQIYLQNGDSFLGFTLTDGASAQATVQFTQDGRVVLRTGDANGAALATIPGAFVVNAWNSFQVKLVIGPAGSIEVRKNGAAAALASIANVNTRGGSDNSTANGLSMQGNGRATFFSVDDLFICSGSGAAPNDWPGDVRALQQVPVGQVQAQFAVTGAASGWQAVAEAHEDGDASFVSSSIVGQEDVYSLSAVPASVAVAGVSYIVNWRKSDAGARAAQLSVSANGSADTPVATNAAMGTSYAYATAFLPVDPTGAAWTPSTVSSARIGIAVTA